MPAPNPKFPVRLVIDRQEQLPFAFAGIPARGADGGGVWKIDTVTKKIETGDYSLEGYEDQIAIERKSPEDLYKSISHDRERFEREVSRLNCFEGYAAIVVEADLYELVTNKPDYVTIPTQVLAGTFVSWKLKYRAVDWHFFRTRRLAEIMTFRFLHQWLEKDKEMEHHKVERKLKSRRMHNGSKDHYEPEEVEFMKAAHQLQKKLKRYPNFAEVLELAKSLGWRNYPAVKETDAEARIRAAGGGEQ